MPISEINITQSGTREEISKDNIENYGFSPVVNR